MPPSLRAEALGQFFERNIRGNPPIIQMPAKEILDQRRELAAVGLGVSLRERDEIAGKIEVDRLFRRLAAFRAGFARRLFFGVRERASGRF